MKKITFIHTADLHLDSPLLGLKHLPESIFQRLQESTFKALEKIIDCAIEHEVDFIIIAGDLFDGEDRSLRAQTRFRREMYRLADKGISAFVIHGNHDHLGGNSVQIQMPDNVHIFSEHVEVKKFIANNDTSVHIYGFSYPTKHVYEKRIADYNKQSGTDFHIGILHGYLEGSSEHSRYAPFQLNELIDKHFDYWALGHIHKRIILSKLPPIIYPGNIQARHKKETGQKGCYLVTLTDAGAAFEFIESADVIWTEVELNATHIKNIDELYFAVRELIDENRKDGVGTILTLTVDQLCIDENDVDIEMVKTELMELFQDEEKDESSFVWLADLIIKADYRFDREQLRADIDFFDEMFHVIDEVDQSHEDLLSLYSHPGARRYLEKPTAAEQEELMKEAEKLLVRLLKS